MHVSAAFIHRYAVACLSQRKKEERKEEKRKLTNHYYIQTGIKTAERCVKEITSVIQNDVCVHATKIAFKL